MSALLELAHVSLSYASARSVLRDVSLSVAAGETVALTGPSGSGKSSLVRVALGLSAPSDGEVHVRGDVASTRGRVVIPPHERGLAAVFQDLALWPHLSVSGNLEFVLGAVRLSKEERHARVNDALSSVGLSAFASRRPDELSGGQRQRVAIARALVTAPELVILDEPLSNLDVQLREEITDLLRALLKDSRKAALLVTHDPRDVARLADRVIVLEAGSVTQAGTLDDLRQAPATDFVRAFTRALRSEATG